MGSVPISVVLVVLLGWGVAQAGELFTPPLVPRQNNDLIQCQIVNVGGHDRTVAISILDASGEALVEGVPVSAPPGRVLVAAIAMPDAGGEALTPGFCKFVFEGSVNQFRAAGAVYHVDTGVTTHVPAH